MIEFILGLIAGAIIATGVAIYLICYIFKDLHPFNK